LRDCERATRKRSDKETGMPPRGRKRAKAGYMISAVAELYKLHPQTLRLYERVGLLKPSRSQGNTRLYTDQDLERLDVILTLARDMGVNLAGIEIILNMRERMVEMERQMTEFANVVQQELSRVASLRVEATPRHAIVRAAPRVVRGTVREG
jgi:MerR family transcriptional regulator/heat shock protein HspR